MLGSMPMTKKRIDCKVKNYYSSIDDIHRYIVETIIFYKDKPYFLKYNGDYFYLQDTKGDCQKISVSELTGPDFNIASPELGYANVNKYPSGKQVVYAERVVWKRWKQGISHQNTMFHNIEGINIGGGFHGDQGFWDSLMDIYPSVDERASLLEEYGELAISKEVALAKRPSGITLVFYKTKEVGYMTPDSATFFLKKDSYSWIIERYLSDLNLKVVNP